MDTTSEQGTGAEEAEAMKTYTRQGEWHRGHVRRGPTGWIVETHSQIQGRMIGGRVLVPYATCGYPRNIDLDSPHNEWMTVGDALIDGAYLGRTRTLRLGVIVR